MCFSFCVFGIGLVGCVDGCYRFIVLVVFCVVSSCSVCVCLVGFFWFGVVCWVMV